MAKAMSKQNLFLRSLEFAVATLRANMLLLGQSLLTVGVSWLAVFIIPLMVLAARFQSNYGMDVIVLARMYMNECIPAGNCSWELFLNLLRSAQLSGTVHDLQTSLSLWGLFFGVMSAIFVWWSWIGVIRICLALCEKKRASIQLFFVDNRFAIRSAIEIMIGLGIFGVMAALGLVLVILPFLQTAPYFAILMMYFVTFWVAARVSLFAWFFIDHEMPFVDSVKSSFRSTRGYALTIVGIWIVAAIISAIARLLFLPLAWAFSVFIAVPLTYLALTYVYRAVSRR